MQVLLFGFRGRFTRANFWFVLVGVSVVVAVLLGGAFVSSVLSAAVDAPPPPLPLPPSWE